MFFFEQTHSGSVWKVTWAHPEFGQVIATCSFDRTAVVWEEQGNVFEAKTTLLVKCQKLKLKVTFYQRMPRLPALLVRDKGLLFNLKQLWFFFRLFRPGYFLDWQLKGLKKKFFLLN